MGVFRVFLIVQMVPNCAKHRIFKTSCRDSGRIHAYRLKRKINLQLWLHSYILLKWYLSLSKQTYIYVMNAKLNEFRINNNH